MEKTVNVNGQTFKVETYFLQHKKDEFYIKPVTRGKWAGKVWYIVDGYDKSHAGFEFSYEKAVEECNKLNEMNNKYRGFI